MTKKDYELIAMAISNGCPESESDDYDARYDTWRNTVQYIAGALFLNNTRFDCFRFLKACGIED